MEVEEQSRKRKTNVLTKEDIFVINSEMDFLSVEMRQIDEKMTSLSKVVPKDEKGKKAKAEELDKLALDLFQKNYTLVEKGKIKSKLEKKGLRDIGLAVTHF